MSTQYFSRESHIESLISSAHYHNLILLRNTIEEACNQFFRSKNAPKVDMFLIARGISPPTGKVSDSSPIPVKFGDQSSFLVDSAQFGLEPLVCGSFDLVYCFSPSFRGEDADDHHLNQFYMCEAELKGDLERCMRTSEDLIKYLIQSVLHAYE